AGVGDFIELKVTDCVQTKKKLKLVISLKLSLKMDLSDYEVPRVLVTCRRRQIYDENDDENVPLYYHINKDFSIPFEREEFCLVIGLRFGVQNWAEYDTKQRIPFRRRVFPSYLDGQPITGNDIANLILDESFAQLYNDDAIVLCCLGILQLVILGVESKRVVPDWIAKHLAKPLLRTHDDVEGIFYQNIPNRGRREQFPSKYKLTPFMEQPPTTILPKERVNKTKNKGTKANLSPLKILGAFEDDNVEENNVTFLGSQFTGNFLMYENVDPQRLPHDTPIGWLSGEHMNSWMELLIRRRDANANWTVAYTSTISVHPENNRLHTTRTDGPNTSLVTLDAPRDRIQLE
ncbi:hypothetical protein Tco_0779073, partial [Tanacetum coccineum]